MTGDARKSFMSSCLSGGSAWTKKPHCTKGRSFILRKRVHCEG